MVEKKLKIEEQAKNLISVHLGIQWDFLWSKTKVAIGDCHDFKKVIRLSEAYMDQFTLTNSKGVILHEIAHGIAGCSNKHNAEWRRVAKSLGIVNPRARTKDFYPVGSLDLVCAHCNHVLIRGRQRRSNMSNKHHAPCGPVNGRLIWRKV